MRQATAAVVNHKHVGARTLRAATGAIERRKKELQEEKVHFEHLVVWFRPLACNGWFWFRPFGCVMLGRRQERPSPSRGGIVRSHAHSRRY